MVITVPDFYTDLYTLLIFISFQKNLQQLVAQVLLNSEAGYDPDFQEHLCVERDYTNNFFSFTGGLLSVIVDAYMNGTLDDALIVPIAINYDKLLDGNFIREQMGQSKVNIILHYLSLSFSLQVFALYI